MKKAHSRLDESVRDLAMILAVMGRGVEPLQQPICGVYPLWALSAGKQTILVPNRQNELTVVPQEIGAWTWGRWKRSWPSFSWG